MSVPARQPNAINRLRLWSAVLLALLGSTWLAGSASAWPDHPEPDQWPTVVAGQFRFHIQPVSSSSFQTDESHFTTEFYPAFSAALDHAEAVIAFEQDTVVDVDVYARSGQFAGRIAETDTKIGPFPAVVFEPASGAIVVDLPTLLAASEVLAEDAIRNAIAQSTVHSVTKGFVPPALRDGIALYLAYPTPEYLARLAATVETADVDDRLFTWFDLFTTGVSGEQELALGESYAIVGSLINRYDIPSLRTMLAELGTGSSWDAAMRTAFSADAATLEANWRANLPAWTTSGWRDNLMSSFDLQPARDLLAQGQYVAAKATLGPAQNLYRQLGDTEALAEVQQLIGQADTGIQAEALMVEIETALNAFDYARAANLLDQVDTQFALLPPSQVPNATLETYHEIANDGLIAMGQLQTASRLAGSWGRYPEARSAAQDAGDTFAELGDAPRQAEAVAVVDQLDNRQRRLVVLLGGLGLLTLAWLFFWLRARGPSDVVWT